MPADPEQTTTLRLSAELENLHRFQEFAIARAAAMGMPEEYGIKIELVIEELVVNVIHYAYPEGDGEIELSCQAEKQGDRPCFCIRIRDGGIAFNPLERDRPDTDLNVTDRPVGGLGILLAEEVADSLFYERRDNCNIMICCFFLPSQS